MSLSLSTLICVLIFVFSAQNGDASGSVSEGLTRRLFPSFSSDNVVLHIEHILRKIAHFMIYFSLGITVFLTCDSFVRCFANKDPHSALIIIIPLIFCFIYSVTDELHQCFVPGRNGTFIDCLLDTAGSFCGIMILILIRHIISRIKRNKT